MKSRAIAVEVAAAAAALKTALVPFLMLSAVINILLLAGSFFMLLVYDEVLPSRSIPTLFGLLVMVAIAYGFQTALDIIRSRAMIQAGAMIDERLSDRVFDVMRRYELKFGPMREGLMPVRDLDSVRNYITSQGPTALLDLPWVLLFLAILFGFHWALGVTTLAGLAVMVGIMLMTDRLTKEPIRVAAAISNARLTMGEATRRNAEVVHALGMSERMRASWHDLSAQQLQSNDRLSEVSGRMQGLSKSFRMLLQSLMLAVGAFLVINGNATGGIIIAGSILSARALMPVEQTIANWKSMTAARQAWERLDRLFAQLPQDVEPLALPPASKTLQVSNLVSGPPGTPAVTLSNISFALKAGSAMAIVGRSGSGKSTLLRVLAGAWPVLRGSVRLDGVTLDQWSSEALGRQLGYVPQSIELFDGTIAQNISRFDPEHDPARVLAAAKAAEVHDLIVHLPGGYEFQLGPSGGNLSAGQKQRIALARAMYGDPFLMILDEPNSNLDTEGELALAAAIDTAKARGAIVIVVAHRPAIMSKMDYILIMSGGGVEQFGTREDIIARHKAVSDDPAVAPIRPARPVPVRSAS